MPHTPSELRFYLVRPGRFELPTFGLEASESRFFRTSVRPLQYERSGFKALKPAPVAAFAAFCRTYFS